MSSRFKPKRQSALAYCRERYEAMVRDVQQHQLRGQLANVARDSDPEDVAALLAVVSELIEAFEAMRAVLIEAQEGESWPLS